MGFEILPPSFGGHGEDTKAPSWGLGFLNADFAQQKKAQRFRCRCAFWEDGKVGLEIHDFGDFALVQELLNVGGFGEGLNEFGVVSCGDVDGVVFKGAALEIGGEGN